MLFRSLSGAVLLASLIMTPRSGAVAAYPGLLKGRLSDGTEISYRIVGDEHSHTLISSDGFILRHSVDGLMEKGIKADLEEIAREGLCRAKKRNLSGPSFPTTGNLKGVVLLVEFSDNSFTEGHDQTLFREMMNQKGFNKFGATGSARDYFVDQSMGKFNPDFDVFGPVKLSKTMKYYGANDHNGQDSHPGDMVKEACEYAAAEMGVDFSQYDYNNDGTVDFVYVIYAGYAESYGASSNTIWPHASALESLGVHCSVSGKNVSRYACSSELKYISGKTLEGIGTFCHEFGHVLGLPDLYNTRSQGSIQLGSWDVMDQGNYNNESHTPPAYSAFERNSLGWMELTELDTPADEINLDELTENNVAFRISTADENEFFILENRQQKGWDAYQASKGLMITHIAYDKSAWDGNCVNSGIIPRVDMEEADGIQSSGSTEGDLFPFNGNDMFTDYSSPSSLSWNNVPTEKGVTNIRVEEGVVKFKFMNDILATPSDFHISELTADSFTVEWSPVENAETYSLSIREILDDAENPLILSEDFSKLESGNYPNADMGDVADRIDEYLDNPGWRGNDLYQAGGMLMMGYYGKSGQLNSPTINLSQHNGEATIAMHLVSYPGKSVNFTASLIDENKGAYPIEEMEAKVTKAGCDLIWHVTKGSDKSHLEFSTKNERVYIDNLRVMTGYVEDDEVWTCGPRNWEIENISETKYTVGGLVEKRTYLVSVSTMPCNGLHGSTPSEQLSVSPTAETRIIENEVKGCVKTEYFDLFGRHVTSGIQSPVIKVEILSDGSRRVSKLFLNR